MTKTESGVPKTDIWGNIELLIYIFKESFQIRNVRILWIQKDVQWNRI